MTGDRKNGTIYRWEEVKPEKDKKRLIAKLIANTDKINGIITLIIVLANILYMYYWSVSIVLNAIIIMWTLIMIPTILTYFRGRGDDAWKSI